MKPRIETPGKIRALLPATLLAFAVGCAGASVETGPAAPAPAEPAPDQPAAADPPPATGAVGLANPASVNCEEQGGELEMIEGPGGTAGVCRFDDGSRCEEWRYFRGECKPGQCQEPSGVCD